MSGPESADHVLEHWRQDIPDDGIVQAAIIIVQYYRPAQDTDVERGPFLAFRRDTEHGTWNHLGMLESVVGDLRMALTRGFEPDD